MEQFDIIDNNFNGPLVKIRNRADGEEMWARRSRVHLVGQGYILTSERQAQLLRGALARQKAREVKRLAKEKLAREEKAAELKTEVAA